MAEETKNLCAQIPRHLHTRVREAQEASGMPLGQYMTQLITKFYEYEEGGTANVNGETRTVAFQAPAELMDQLKAYLKKHNIRQKDFFLDCIQRALADDQEE